MGKRQARVVQIVAPPYNLLIRDEPTNHLDIKAKEVLKGALQAFDGTLIVVSHDQDFLSVDGTCTITPG